MALRQIGGDRWYPVYADEETGVAKQWDGRQWVEVGRFDPLSIADQRGEAAAENEMGALEAGLTNLQADIEDAVAGVAQQFGADDIASGWRDSAEDLRGEVAEGYSPRVGSFAEIRKNDGIGPFVSDLGNYAGNMFQQSAAYMGPALGGGIAGLVATGGNPVGGTAGAIAGGIPQWLGGNVREQIDRGVDPDDVNMAAAGGTAVVQASLDATIARLFPGIGRAASGGLARRMIGRGVEGAGQEAATEVLQEAAQIAQVDPNLLMNLSPEDRTRLVEGAIGGAILGGPIGAAGGIFPPPPETAPGPDPVPDPAPEAERERGAAPVPPGLPSPDPTLALPSPDMVARQAPPDLGRTAVYPVGGGYFAAMNPAGEQRTFDNEAAANAYATADTRPPPRTTMDRLAAAQQARRTADSATPAFAPASGVPARPAQQGIAGLLPPPQPTVPPISSDPYSPLPSESGPAIAMPGGQSRPFDVPAAPPSGPRVMVNVVGRDGLTDAERGGPYVPPAPVAAPRPGPTIEAIGIGSDGASRPFDIPGATTPRPTAAPENAVTPVARRGQTRYRPVDPATAYQDQFGAWKIPVQIDDPDADPGTPPRTLQALLRQPDGRPGKVDLPGWEPPSATQGVEETADVDATPSGTSAVNDGPSVAERDGDAAAQGAVADAQTMEETGAPPVVDARERQRQENIARVQEALPGYPVGNDVYPDDGRVTAEALNWLSAATDEMLDTAEQFLPHQDAIKAERDIRAARAEQADRGRRVADADRRNRPTLNPPPSGRPAIISTVPDALTQLNARLPEGFTAERSTEDNAEVLVSDAAGNVVARDRVPTGTVTLDQIVEDIGRRPAPTPTDTASLESMFTDLVAEEFGDTTPAARPAPESRPAPAAPPASSPAPAASEPAPASAPRGPTVDFVSVGPDGQSSTFTPNDPTLAAAGQSTASGRPVRPRTAGEAAGSAARNLGGAASDGLRGLMQLFGNADPNRLGSGPTFDEETYRQAVPYFKSAAQQVGAAAQDVADIMRAIIRALRDMGMDRAGVDRMAPYAVRFIQDVQAGRETLDGIPSQSDRDGGNIEGSDQETRDGGQIRDLGEEGEPPASGGGRQLSGAEDRDGTGSDNALEGEPTADDEAVGGGRGGRGGRSRSGGSRAGSRVPPRGTGVSADGRDGNRDGGLDDDGAGGRAARGGRRNFHLTDPKSIVGGTPKKRFAKNRAAIETLRELQESGREPTAEELNTLAGYTGWGSFGQELFQGNWQNPRPKDGWQREDEWLREHLGKAEWESAQRSIINAHYTDPPTVQAMWDMARAMGFKGGRVLEPSAGVGNFLGLMPRDLEGKSQITAIELDTLTADIAKILYPQANVQQKGYQESQTPDDFYDLVIGNWPFAADGPADRRYMKLNPSLHDYFFLKGLDQVRPGGLVIGITSAGTMDKKGTNTRAALAEKADLVASFRLPSGAFDEYAGTSVVTDIIVFQKRDTPNTAPRREPWIPVQEIDTPAGEKITVNGYYADNRDAVLGTLNYGSGTTYGRAAMIVDRPADLMERLNSLKDRVPADIMTPQRRGSERRFVTNNTDERQGAVTVGGDGDIWVVRGEQLVELNTEKKWRTQNAKQTDAREDQFKRLIEMRRTQGALLDAERSGAENAEALRSELRNQYRAFKRDHGAIRKSFAAKHMDGIRDPFIPSLRALETNDGKEAAILSRPTLRPERKLDNPTINDAYVIARNESLLFDVDRVAELAKRSVPEVIDTLTKEKAIYLTPGGGYEAADTYLSGNVRAKLRSAQDAVERGEPMESSVDALKAVIPSDIPYFQIEAKPGASWIPFDVYRDWIAALVDMPPGSLDEATVPIQYTGGRWKVEVDSGLNRTAMSTAWHHDRYPFSRMVQAAMNNTRPTITDRTSDGTVRRPDLEEEIAVKIAQMRENIQEWIWSDPTRRDRVAEAYNETMNAIVSPKYDGTFLDMSGMMLARGDQPFNLRSHQLNAIWRGLLNGAGIYGHEVGTGKTYTMAGLAVESRRYGRAKKPLILAHNANSAAVANEINEMYPGAKVLYLGGLKTGDISTAIQQIAMDDWDAVVMPHSMIDKLTLTEKTLMDLAADEIAELELAAEEAAESDGVQLPSFAEMENEDSNAFKHLRSPTAKNMVKQRNRIIERIRKNAMRGSKADAITFEQLGVDMLIVDEAHEFKKPPFATRMKMKGLNQDTSGRSVQLDFLVKHITRMNGGTGVHLFTGTPITNTLTEIFHMMRYAMRGVLSDADIDQWDGWFNTFASEVDDIEITASGAMEPVVRLASFINVADLRRMASQFLDVVFADDMPEFKPRETASGKTMADDLTDAERNELENGRTETPVGRPYKKIINDVADMNPAQVAARAEIIAELQRFKNMTGQEKKRNKHIPLVMEGRSAAVALDPRLDRRGAPDDPNSKVRRATRNVLEIAKDPNATQMIFVEQGYSDRRKIKSRDPETGEVTERSEPAFNLVKEITDLLLAGGIKREQIAVVKGGTKPEEKAAIAEAMNRGDIRVMIGQTGTMGTGVNAQTNLRAMHHLDAPWMPGELEQRNGRGWRQGNKWNTVLEYRYMTDRLDGRRWQVLAVKARFIRDFLEANEDTRIIEGDAADDTGNSLDDLTESLSQAAGDSRIMLRAKLQGDVEKLTRRWEMYEQGAREARRDMSRRGDLAESYEREAARIRKDAAAYDQSRITKENFVGKIKGQSFNDIEAFNSALAAVQQEAEATQRPSDQVNVGTIGEWKIKAEKQGYSFNGRFAVDLSVVGAAEHEFEKPTVASIQAVLARLEAKAQRYDAAAAEARDDAARLKRVADTPFGQMDKLESKRAALTALEEDLSNNPEPPPAWLRQGAPVQTKILVNGKEREVTGHKWSSDGWFIVTDEGNVPYLEARDMYGTPLYEEREFEPPPIELKESELSEEEARGHDLLQAGDQWQVVRGRDRSVMGQGRTKKDAIRQFRLAGRGLSTNTDAEVDAAAENVSYSLAPLGRQSKGRAAAAAEVIGLVSQMTGGQAEVTTAEVIYGAGQGLQRSGALTGERQRVAGFYDPTRALVGVALDGYEADVTAVHEAVHFLQDKGLIPEADRTLLRADRARLERAAIGEGFEPEAAKRMTQTELEAVAAQGYYRRRKVGENLGGYSMPMRRVFNRLMQFFERLGNALRGRGYRSLNDVFGDMIEGRMANPPKLTGREFGTTFQEIRAAAEEFLIGLRGRTVINDATGMEIGFNRTGAKRTQRAGEDLLRAIPAIETLLKQGRPLPQQAVYPEKRERNIRAVHKFRAEAIIAGRRKPLVLTVRETVNGTYYYTINDDARREEALTGATAVEPSSHWKDSPAGDSHIAAEMDVSNPEVQYRIFQRAAAPAYAKGRVQQDQTPDAIKDVMGRVMAQPDNRSIRERARDAKAAYSGKLKSKLRTGLVDDFDPLREPYPRAWRRYKQTRNLSSVINHVIEFGHMRWDPESRWFASGAATNDRKPIKGVKGLRQVFQPAIDAGLLDTWKAHRIAKRAKRLAAEGLERLVSQEDIAKVEAAVAGLTDQQREILAQTDRDFNRLNRGMIKAAVDSGLIDGDIAEQLLQHGDWIPFYRVLDGDATAGGLLADRKNPQANLKRLKGSTREMLDPLEGITRNYIRLTDAMYKNAAKRQAHKLMIQQGDAEFMSPGRVPVDKAMVDGRLSQLAAEYGFKPDNLPPATVSAWRKMIRDQIIEETMTRDGDVSVHYERGAKRFVRVHDPEMLATIEAVGPRETDRLLRLMGIPKRILTKTVTATPVFMTTNAVRDTLGAWVTGETKGFRPFAGAAVGAVKAMRNDPDLLQMMATGSGSGGYFGTTSKHIEDRMKRMDPAKRSAFQKTVVDTPAKMWDAWERIGQASEAANRLEIYQKQRQAGVGVADAAFMGMDLIDFASTGKWWVARALIEVVPFLNPRIQGLDKLARTMTGRRALINGSIIAAASMALAAANGDDERYERLENWEKNLYWHIWLDDDPDSSPIRIPKPFEVGILFGSVWERIVDQATGRDQPADFRTFIQDSLTDTLAFNPWPQAILPYVEMTQNRSHFYDRPIETFGMEFRDPETRYNERTSETMRVISAALAESPAQGAELSPVQLEHLWKGYFGTLGTYVLGAADQVTRWAGDFPDRPSDGMRGIPVLGPVIRRFSPDGVSRNSRYLTEFYNFASEIDQLKSTLNWAQNNNDERLIAEIMGDERDRALLGARSAFRDLRGQFSDANERIRQIRNSDLSRDEKRRRIDAISLRMHQRAQTMVDRLNERLN